MKSYITAALSAIVFVASYSCVKNTTPDITEDSEKWPEYEAPVPETIEFSNAEFIYNGDDIGEGISDGWLVRLYTDMEIDSAGNPIGPGVALQLLLNVTFDKDQSADPEFLSGVYTEMLNSGNFAAGTFVSGYIDYIDMPGGRIEIADATFYADIADGSTEMDYDLIDEGALEIKRNPDGTYSIEGVLVGKKYTKRYISWNGDIQPKSNVPEEIPNSTLDSDVASLEFSQGHVLDKGDCFYLKDDSYRCFLVFLTDKTIDMSTGRPAGNGRFLRLEFLVPWSTKTEDGIPAGTYSIAERNPDTSMDRDKIVPGIAIAGLPDCFSYPYISGSWYVEMQDGIWSDKYARVSGGSINVVRGADGGHDMTFNLTDCQESPKTISGKAVFKEMITH